MEGASGRRCLFIECFVSRVRASRRLAASSSVKRRRTQPAWTVPTGSQPTCSVMMGENKVSLGCWSMAPVNRSAWSPVYVLAAAAAQVQIRSTGAHEPIPMVPTGSQPGHLVFGLDQMCSSVLECCCCGRVDPQRHHNPSMVNGSCFPLFQTALRSCVHNDFHYSRYCIIE